MPTPSLSMLVERADDGTYTIVAPWLPEPVSAPSWEEAYWEAMAKRRRG